MSEAHVGNIVKHQREGNRGRFFVKADGDEAELEYEISGDVVIAYHTYTPPRLRGRGIAAEMVKALVDMATREGLKIKPLCSYVAKYFEEHYELSELVAR